MGAGSLTADDEDASARDTSRRKQGERDSVATPNFNSIGCRVEKKAEKSRGNKIMRDGEKYKKKTQEKEGKKKKKNEKKCQKFPYDWTIYTSRNEIIITLLDGSFARVRFRTHERRCQTGHRLLLACSSRLPTLVNLAFPDTRGHTHDAYTEAQDRLSSRGVESEIGCGG
ncbi:hypothetical protein PUN28_013385 [Cardiocondyla obscurior]|uniref:Uncharacterized protein n=1 Tax=Cardiocondyla obscurior TaxID=286306 RepID=A0AAW2F9E4_9HYME